MVSSPAPDSRNLPVDDKDWAPLFLWYESKQNTYNVVSDEVNQYELRSCAMSEYAGTSILVTATDTMPLLNNTILYACLTSNNELWWRKKKGE